MGTWHLVGYCHLRKGLRDFNLARIKDIAVLSDLFTPRDNFSFSAISILLLVCTKER